MGRAAPVVAPTRSAATTADKLASCTQAANQAAAMAAASDAQRNLYQRKAADAAAKVREAPGKRRPRTAPKAAAAPPSLMTLFGGELSAADAGPAADQPASHGQGVAVVGMSEVSSAIHEKRRRGVQLHLEVADVVELALQQQAAADYHPDYPLSLDARLANLDHAPIARLWKRRMEQSASAPLLGLPKLVEPKSVKALGQRAKLAEERDVLVQQLITPPPDAPFDMAALHKRLEIAERDRREAAANAQQNRLEERLEQLLQEPKFRGAGALLPWLPLPAVAAVAADAAVTAGAEREFRGAGDSARDSARRAF